jgi:hypothetical protein
MILAVYIALKRSCLFLWQQTSGNVIYGNPLVSAAYQGYTEVVDMLLAAGAEVNQNLPSVSLQNLCRAVTKLGPYSLFFDHLGKYLSSWGRCEQGLERLHRGAAAAERR